MAGEHFKVFYDEYREEPDRGERGARLSAGERAAGRAFRVEFRYGDGFLVVRKSQDPYVPKEARDAAALTGNGRKRKRRQRDDSMAATPGDMMASEGDVPVS